jgi:pyrimidine operon attenuation protein/uracil phosphoribosyltransferase
MMDTTKTLILNSRQIEQKIERIAYEIYEDNFEESEIVIAGIMKSGFVLAKKIEVTLNRICNLKTSLAEIHIDKTDQANHKVIIKGTDDLKNKVVILVDDVLNSGKTLIYSLRAFLDADLKKIRTVLLVDRDHKRYPILADFVGITLSTTLQEHITVELTAGEEAVFLS